MQMTTKPGSLVLAPGASTVLTVPDAAGRQVVWRSANPAIATVDPQGLVVALADGATQIIGSVQLGPTYPNAIATVLVSRYADSPRPHRVTNPRAFACVAPPPKVTFNAGGIWAEFERKWLEWSDRHWYEEGAGDDKYDSPSVNYYDRAAIYFGQWLRSVNSEHLRRAEAIVRVYRAYVNIDRGEGPGRIDMHNMQPDGLALHWLILGDADSRRALGHVADYYTAPRWLDSLVHPNSSNRVQARWLHTLLAAWTVDAPSPRSVDWLPWLRTGVDLVLSTQGADGAWRYASVCNHVWPFQMSMVTDVLARYYDTVDQDPRVLNSIKRAADIMWETCWLPDAKLGNVAIPTMAYLSGECATGTRGPAFDVANLVAHTYMWLARKLNDESYMAKADMLFLSAVRGGFWSGVKQFNQITNMTALRYLALRFES